jgi:hypothetical protein
MLKLPTPRLQTGKPIIVACPMSEEQHAIQDELVVRYERLRSQRVDPREDNALNITTDGRKLATDARMLSAAAKDYPHSKVNALVERVFQIWEQFSPIRGTQLIFADMGVRPTAWGYCVYDEVIAKVVACGIPEAQIAAAGDAESDAKKQALFEKVRNGQIRVLIGSTQKMGTGTNVQKRLVALHHLDAPWKPAEVEQREGRILRQGNDNKEVAIFRYVTEQSFDAYMWQALETKARFINQVMTGANAARRAEDIGGQELSYAEVKAIASGNPAVLTLAETDAELQRLGLLRKNHADEQYLARRNVKTLPDTIKELSQRLNSLLADQAVSTAADSSRITLRNRSVTLASAVELLTSALGALPKQVPQRRGFPLGIYRGLRFGAILHPNWPPEIYLEGQATRTDTLSREHHGPRAVLNALERLVKNYAPEVARVKQDLGIAEAQLRDFQTRLGVPFIHEAYLEKLTALRDLLKAALVGTTTDSNPGPLPTSADFAAQIQSLKATQTIGAAPPRVSRFSAFAEQPVTAQIRRRSEIAQLAQTGS